MKEHLIQIDAGACIGCGLCSRDCPENNIRIKDRKAVLDGQNCIKCGHCVAICPKAAVAMTGFDEPPEELESRSVVDSHRLLEALKARRSVRRFQNRPVPDEVIAQIVEAGRFTPTAKNLQDVSYVVLREEIGRCEALAVRFFQKLLPFAKLFYPPAGKVAVDGDFFFKKAPAAIVIYAKDKINGALAASNMALMAEANGLGVLYSGFFTIAANHAGRLRKTLRIKGKQAVTTLVLGYPDVAYRRTAQKETAEVRRL